MPTCSRAAALTTKALAQGAAVSASFRLKGRCFCTETQTARAGAGREEATRGCRPSSTHHAPRLGAPCAQQLLLLRNPGHHTNRDQDLPRFQRWMRKWTKLTVADAVFHRWPLQLQLHVLTKTFVPPPSE